MQDDMRRVTYESNETTATYNEQTGELTSSTTKKRFNYRYSKEPPYIKLYLDHLSRFKGIQLSLNPILLELFKRATWAGDGEESEGMILYLNRAMKSTIAKICEVSLSRVDHAVTEFVKKQYMRRLDVGMYQFNPYFFGKGDWEDIANIRATFDYGTGEAFAEIVKKEEDAMNHATDEIANQSNAALKKIENNGVNTPLSDLNRERA